MFGFLINIQWFSILIQCCSSFSLEQEVFAPLRKSKSALYLDVFLLLNYYHIRYKKKALDFIPFLRSKFLRKMVCYRVLTKYNIYKNFFCDIYIYFHQKWHLKTSFTLSGWKFDWNLILIMKFFLKLKSV